MDFEIINSCLSISEVDLANRNTKLWFMMIRNGKLDTHIMIVDV